MNYIVLIVVFVVVIVVVATVALLLFINQRFSKLAKEQENSKSNQLLNDWIKQTSEQMAQLRQEMGGRIDKNTDTMQSQLDKTNKAINERLDNAARVISSISKELGQMSEMGRQMRDLQDFLRSPKLRGNIGEQVLADLIKQVIPHEYYALQYTFKDGQRVDAVIKTAEGMVPIDAKFPMDSFKRLMEAQDQQVKTQSYKEFERDVKKHLDDIAKKYILPQEGTLDFALMYVPSESVAYEVFVNHPDLMTHANKKRVSIVSPNQFHAFLKVVLMGLERQQVGQKAKLVLDSLRAIQKDAERFSEEYRVLLKHISNAKTMADQADQSLGKLTTRIESAQRIQALDEGDDSSNKVIADE